MRKLITLALVAGCTGLFAQDSSTAQGSATANVIAPLKLEHKQGAILNFGGFFTGQEDWVHVQVDGRHYSATGRPVRAEGYSVDEFTLTGDPRYSFTLQVANPYTLTNGDKTMELYINDASFNGYGAGMAWRTWGPLHVDNSGNCGIKIGGFVHATADQAPGNYSGSYNLTAVYE